MSTGIDKPKRHELQSDLLAIAEIPDRVKVITSIRLQELIIFVNNEILNRLNDINQVLLDNPTTTFEFWAQNYYSVFNYNQLIQLREILREQLNSEIEKKSPKNQNPEIISQVFKTNGFEIFNYLDEHFKAFNNRPPTKYTILYHFLEGKIIYPNKTKFIEFVRSFCNEKLKNSKFSKIESDYKINSNYTDNEPYLIQLYNEYLENSKS